MNARRSARKTVDILHKRDNGGSYSGPVLVWNARATVRRLDELDDILKELQELDN